MIAFLDGKIARVISTGLIELAVGPIAFEVHTPGGYDFGFAEGDEARLFTHMIITAERPLIYGFKSAFDRDVFRLLLTANQVGPRAALSILELGGDAVIRAIQSGDSRTLTAAPGIGQKKAEKIVLELKDKAAGFAFVPGAKAGFEDMAGKTTKAETEAVQALVGLGFPHQAAIRAVTAAQASTNEEMDAPNLIKAALKKVNER